LLLIGAIYKRKTKMKKLLLVAILLTSSTAHASVLCQSLNDPSYKAWFPGYSCPAGYFMIKMG
jgi:hypothetical protein